MKKLKKPMKPKPSKKVKKARKPNPPKRPKKRAPPKPKTKTSAQPAVPITADGFPALAEFFRGYFHEDMADDYGSMVGAAEQFCLDADHIQIEKLYRDWLRFTANTCKMDLDGLTALLDIRYRCSGEPDGVSQLVLGYPGAAACVAQPSAQGRVEGSLRRRH